MQNKLPAKLSLKHLKRLKLTKVYPILNDEVPALATLEHIVKNSNLGNDGFYFAQKGISRDYYQIRIKDVLYDNQSTKTIFIRPVSYFLTALQTINQQHFREQERNAGNIVEIRSAREQSSDVVRQQENNYAQVHKN